MTSMRRRPAETPKPASTASAPSSGTSIPRRSRSWSETERPCDVLRLPGRTLDASEDGELGGGQDALRAFARGFPCPLPPNRTCTFPRIRLSTSFSLVKGDKFADLSDEGHIVVVRLTEACSRGVDLADVVWGDDLCAPKPVTLYCHLRRVI